MKVTLLGTGTSTGIPVINCSCAVCRSNDPRDRRTRSAAFVEVNGLSVVIDTGPDFRNQVLRENIRRVDAVLYTHHHFDHVVGVDDLRPFLFDNASPIPCFARENTAAVLRRMFPYIFVDRSYPGVPNLTLSEVDGPFRISGRYDPAANVSVCPIAVFHGKLPVHGYRIGTFAYLTDVSHIPDEAYSLLEGLDVLVLNTLRYEPHPTHFTVEESVAAARRIGARRTWFTHMTHSLSHAEVDARLPEGMQLGYDGLTITIP